MVLFLFTAPAFAEVSEKILSVPGMWVQAVLIGCVAILVGGEENGRQKILMSVEHGQRPQIRVL